MGYVLHSLLLVPYYSWQRSHAVHHSRTNHLTEGETHCPPVAGVTLGGAVCRVLHAVAGGLGVGAYQLVTHLLLGWPAYLLAGATGGPSRGFTNHFVPTSGKLFPGWKWKVKVLLSDVGVVATACLVYYWAAAERLMSETSSGAFTSTSGGAAGGGWWTVAAVYGGPYLGVNFWLVFYTWLQHTDVDVPHLDGADWTWEKGAFLTIDRPYGAILDFLHHRIGSTHVAHHLCSRIPHYHAREATLAIKNTFPAHYLYDPTPVWRALWRVATQCVEVQKVDANKAEGPTTLWMFFESEGIHTTTSTADGSGRKKKTK